MGVRPAGTSIAPSWSCMNEITARESSTACAKSSAPESGCHIRPLLTVEDSVVHGDRIDISNVPSPSDPPAT